MTIMQTLGIFIVFMVTVMVVLKTMANYRLTERLYYEATQDTTDVSLRSTVLFKSVRKQFIWCCFLVFYSGVVCGIFLLNAYIKAL